MKVSNAEVYAFKRFLYKNKGIVVPMSTRGAHPKLQIPFLTIKTMLKTFVSKGILEKYGNWQHVWYFLTEEGEKLLKDTVELPEELFAQEQLEIKN